MSLFAFAEWFPDHAVDGLAFLELTIDELNKLLPDKLGIVKKIYRLIQAVSNRSSQLNVCTCVRVYSIFSADVQILLNAFRTHSLQFSSSTLQLCFIIVAVVSEKNCIM